MAQLLDGATLGTWSGYTRYVYLSGDVSRSGNVVTLSNLQYHFSATGAAAYGYNETLYIKQGSSILSSTSTQWRFTGGTSPTINLNNASTTVGASDTSLVLSLGCDNETVTADFTITFPAGYTAPDTPTVRVVSSTATSVTIEYGTTSFGNPNTGTVYLYQGTTSTPTAQAESKTATGLTQTTITGLTAGVTYYFRARAYNEQLYSGYSTAVSVVPSIDASIGLLGSVNDAATEVRTLLGSVSGAARRIVKLYGHRTFVETVVSSTSYCTVDETTLFAKIKETVGNGSIPREIAISSYSSASGGHYTISLSYSPAESSSTAYYVITDRMPWALASITLVSWGIRTTSEPAALASLVEFSTTSTEGAGLVYRR